MPTTELKHLRADAYDYLLAADRPLPTHRIARRLFGPRRHERPEAQVVVRTLLEEDDRFLETHDGRWAAREAPHLRLPLSQASFAVVDLETTGSLIGVDQIIEIGIVVCRHDRVVERFSTLVRTERKIPHWVANLTGIRAADLKQAPRFGELAPTLLELLAGTVFVAHDIRFDLPFLRWELASRGLRMPMTVGLCTLRLSRALWPDLPSRSLHDLARRFAVTHRHPHRADEDAAATAGILIRALGVAAELGLRDLGDLYLLQPNGGAEQTGPDTDLAAEAAD